MNTINITINAESSGERIVLGRRGESYVTQIVFDATYLTQMYGQGIAQLAARRPGEATPYPVAVEQDGSTVTWTVSNADTVNRGVGECELFWYLSGEAPIPEEELWLDGEGEGAEASASTSSSDSLYLAKSIVFTTVVAKDIGGEGEAPSAYESWLEQALASGAAAMRAQAAIEDMTVTASSLSPSKSATVTKTEEDGVVNLHFGIPRGRDGQGLPTGGLAGQVLTKYANADYNAHWQTPESDVFIAEYEQTYINEIGNAFYAGKAILCKKDEEVYYLVSIGTEPMSFTFGIPSTEPTKAKRITAEYNAAELTHTRWRSAEETIPLITDTASGSLASFPDGADGMPLVSLTAASATEIKRAGKNILPFPYTNSTSTSGGVTRTVNSDGTISLSGTATAVASFVYTANLIDVLKPDVGDVLIFTDGLTYSSDRYSRLLWADTSSGIGAVNGSYSLTITQTHIDRGIRYELRINSGANCDNLTVNPMVRVCGDDTYEPYAVETFGVGDDVTTVLGANNIWADTGDVSVEYVADTKMYIDKQIAELQALVLES